MGSGCRALFVNTVVVLAMAVAAQRDPDPDKYPAVVSSYTRPPLSANDPISTVATSSGPVFQTGDTNLPLSVTIQPSQTPPLVSVQPSPPPPQQRMDMSDESDTTTVKMKPTVIPETRMREVMSVINVGERGILMTAANGALNQSSAGFGVQPSDQVATETSRIGQITTKSNLPPHFTAQPSTSVDESVIQPDISTQSFPPTPEASVPYSTSYLLLSHTATAVLPNSMSQPPLSDFHTTSPTPSTLDPRLISPSPALRITSSTGQDLLLPTGVPLYTALSEENNTSVIDTLPEHHFISTPVPAILLLSSQTADYLLPQEMSTEILRDFSDISTLPHITPSSAVLLMDTASVEEVVFLQTSVQMLSHELIPTPVEVPPSPLMDTIISASRANTTSSTMDITSSPLVEILPSLAQSLPYFMVETTSTRDFLTPPTSGVLFLISPSPTTISSHQPPDLLLPTGVPLYMSVIEDSLTRTPEEHHLTVTSVPPVLQSLQTILPSFIAPSEPVGHVSSTSGIMSSFEAVSLTQQLLGIASKPFSATGSAFTQPPFSLQTTSSFVSKATIQPMMLLPLTPAPQSNYRTVSVSASIVPSVRGTVLPVMQSSAQPLTAKLSPTPSRVSSSLLMGTTSSSVVIAMGATSSMGGSMANESTSFPARSTLLLSPNTRVTSSPTVTDTSAGSVSSAELTPTPSQVLPPPIDTSRTSITGSVVKQVGTPSSVESLVLSFTTYKTTGEPATVTTGEPATVVPSSESVLEQTLLSSQSLSKTSVTATSQSVSSNPRAIQSLGLSPSTSRTVTSEFVTASAAQQSGEERITSLSTEHTASPSVRSTTTRHSSLTTIPTSTATPPLSQVSTSTPTPSPCNPFTDYTPPPNSIVSIILAVPPLELIKITQVGSLERCLLLEDLARVLQGGLTRKIESARESEANARRKLHKRQMPPEPQYTAVIVDITEDESFGENLVDVRFFILDTSGPASPHSLNSTTVSEAYVLAAVDEISGYTIVRQAEPLAVEDYFTPATDDSGPSSRIVVGLILAAAFLATLAVILGLLALGLLWRRRHLKTVKLQATTGATRISLVNRTLIPTTSFEYESQPILQMERPVLSAHVTPASSHESLESADSLPEVAKEQSVTSLSQLAQETHRQILVPDAGPGSSEQVVTTLTHLAAAHSVSSESVHSGERESTPKDPNERATTEMLERVTHYSSPHLSQRPHHLPPLKPRFHHTTTTSDPHLPPQAQAPPPTPPQSPSPTSTFRRLPTPPPATLTNPETEHNNTTPKRRKKRRRRRRHSTRPSSRGGDETMEGLLVEEPETQPNDAEQELWLRRRATMEYHKYITGEESSFHPSFLSYKNQSLGVSSPVGLPPLVQTSPLPPHMEYTVDHEQQSLPGSESESPILEEVEGSEESDSSLQNSETSVSHHKEQVEQEATSAAECEKAKERKEQKHRPPRRIFRRHKIAPVTYSPQFLSSVPAQTTGADLAWMDTVNGPQLMSVKPVPHSQPHLQWRTRPPQYVLPPPHVSSFPVHFVPRSTHSHSDHIPLRHSMARQQTADKQQTKFSGREETVGPENENKKEQLHLTEENRVSAAAPDATPTVPQVVDKTTDKSVTIHKMLGEAFGTSASQIATTTKQEDRVNVNSDRGNSYSQTSPHKTYPVITTIPVQVQPMHGATFPHNVQLVWPFPAPQQQVLQPPTRSFHQSYYPPVYHTLHQPDYPPALRSYGDPTQPSRTSTPRYTKKRPEQH